MRRRLTQGNSITQLSLSEDEIRQAATEKSFERGEDYYDQGAVLEIVRRGRTVYAAVEESEADLYTVRITFGTRGIPEGTCTCPYDYGGW
ncbi:hypothetical protein P7L53_01495 [Thermoleptolyngbya sichuanensis XZ-Cy5]|uniref:SWIM zinc finger family protein n=1 Tax=Thermoleptolyngbya sichuanensis TaxID=2885951 RepID=UPI00240D6E82|nr:hypothetical protein [Thermoleptolyngbya sichuanensis]MDG2614909.1 hypothetical protein [Thermoleptolyngbya sichuanensis XZ-Cy5]